MSKEDAKMKVVIQVPKEVIEYFERYGIVCSEPDGSRYYNDDKWLKVDKDGVATHEKFKNLPDYVKSIHLELINQPGVQQQARERSIAFAEWIGDMGYHKMYKGNEQVGWSNETLINQDQCITTDQLYDLFTQNLK